MLCYVMLYCIVLCHVLYCVVCCVVMLPSPRHGYVDSTRFTEKPHGPLSVRPHQTDHDALLLPALETVCEDKGG